jgi:nicotinamide riboside transporter PnuC
MTPPGGDIPLKEMLQKRFRDEDRRSAFDGFWRLTEFVVVVSLAVVALGVETDDSDLALTGLRGMVFGVGLMVIAVIVSIWTSRKGLVAVATYVLRAVRGKTMKKEQDPYTEEERKMISEGMLDLPIDKLSEPTVDLKKLTWLKLKVMHNDSSERAQITAKQRRWIAILALVVGGLASFVSTALILKSDASTPVVLLGFVSPVIAFGVAFYLGLHPWYVENKKEV